MKRLVNLFSSLIFIPLLIVLSSVGCGGGSAGTGTTTFTGKLLTTDEQPVSGAIVSVVGSDEVTTTDDQGQFTLNAPDENAPYQIQVQAPGVDASVEVPPATADESKIGIQLELDTSNSTVSIKSVEVKVSMIGACKDYFLEYESSLVQSKPLADLTRCTIQVASNSGSRPVGGILADLQRNSCTGAEDEVHSWISVASGRTRETGSRGRVDIKFTFFDDDAHCQYRVVAPSGDKRRTPLIFPIITLRQQGK